MDCPCRSWRLQVLRWIIALMVGLLNEGFDLGFEVAEPEVVFQQSAVLQGLVAMLDFAWVFEMERCAANTTHVFICQIVNSLPAT